MQPLPPPSNVVSSPPLSPSSTLLISDLPTETFSLRTTTPSPPPSPPKENTSSIIFSTTETLTNSPPPPPPPRRRVQDSNSPTRPSDPSLLRGQLLAQHLLGPQAHLRIEQDRALEEAARQGREERLRERVQRREEREKRREEERRERSLYLSSSSSTSALLAPSTSNETTTSSTSSDSTSRPLITIKKSPKLLPLSLSLPSFNVNQLFKKPSFNLKRSSTRPELHGSSAEEMEGKRGIKTVTVQSLARRTRELEEMSGRRDALEEGGRAEVWYLG
ncbi:hypothetical protein BDY24DRAFT_374301 [Mrakia frigida]|uniref:uncharacterized protein n=1 Tax=Mrakia frigida TaxID=29902 RepID=UPI003FCC0DA8